MNGDVVYLDRSAFVKLFFPDSDSRALMRYLASRPQRVSAMLLRTEALRTAVRAPGLSTPEGDSRSRAPIWPVAGPIAPRNPG